MMMMNVWLNEASKFCTIFGLVSDDIAIAEFLGGLQYYVSYRFSERELTAGYLHVLVCADSGAIFVDLYRNSKTLRP